MLPSRAADCKCYNNSMKKMRPLLILMLLGVLFPCRSSHATSDSARAYSIYFWKMTDTGASVAGGVANFYAHKWRTWLQYHRAVEKNPRLRRQLLQLPSDPYEGRKGALVLIHKHLSANFVKSQPSHVFVLQLGVYKTSAGISVFMRRQWPKVDRKSIYDTVPKDFRVGFSSEAIGKTEPIFVILEQPAMRLCYGIYGSIEDAKRDARQFKKFLGYQPMVKRQPLTAQLARSFIFEPVAGKMP